MIYFSDRLSHKGAHVKSFIKSTCLIIFSVFFLLFIPGCGAPPPPEISPEEILSRSVDRMESSAGFEFIIERSGAFAFLDKDEMISFRRATGKYLSPDSFETEVRVIGPGIVVDVFLIGVDGIQWETNILTGEWQLSDPNFNFNPSVFFHPETGLRMFLANDLSDIEYVGFAELVEVPGKPLYYLKAKMNGERVNSYSYGLIDAETLKVSMWVDPDTFDMHRILLVDPVDEGEEEDTIWQIDFWNFDTIFEIAVPIQD